MSLKYLQNRKVVDSLMQEWKHVFAEGPVFDPMTTLFAVNHIHPERQYVLQ